MQEMYWRFPFECRSIGNTARTGFIQDCIENPNQFEKRIKKRNKKHSFPTQSGKRKIWGAERKIIEASLIRDLFGSILCLSMQQEIDMAEVLKYLLTLVPLYLSDVDSWVNSTPKSNLLSYINSQFVAVPPSSIDITIIVAAFFCTCK